MTDYQEFLRSKLLNVPPSGIDPGEVNPMLKDFQRDITKWALRRGRAAVFADCGLGKTPIQLSWANELKPLGPVLILCPLSVADQTTREGLKFGVEVKYCRHQEEITGPITITNYEMLQNFDAGHFKSVVLDESSILKHFDGKTRNLIINSFRETPYKLACTATPAPNDYMELGNHAEFLGVMSRTEMLSMFFVHDGGDTSQWRLKGHAEKEFWRWVCSWAVMLRKPSDLGYSDDGYNLPPLQVKQVTVKADSAVEGLFATEIEARTLVERIAARRNSIQVRTAEAASLCHGNTEQWVCWCALNDEGDELEIAIPDAVQIRGSDKPEHKMAKLRKFLAGEIRVLITKGSITCFGLNWQHCCNTVFVGISDSWEEYYQAVRRFWRFGQTKTVNAYIVTSSTEGAVVANIQRKEADADRMAREMINNMHDLTEQNLKGTARTSNEYKESWDGCNEWDLYLGDCVERIKAFESDSVHYSIFSPPFASLYTYSASERDMGNANGYEEFQQHFAFLIKELYRVMKPGRNVSFHCMQLPLSKSRDGIIALRDFRGIMVKMFQDEGFVYHSEVCIWKDPVTAMQRTKALGLLWKQIKKDSAMSRMGIADYMVTMRKPGDNAEPVTHTAEEFPVAQWQEWASPVWADINPSDTLQYRSAREDEDEKHICPLQLEVIRRGIVLWSNPGDLVLSPFAGIGSEGHIALGGKTRTGLTVNGPRRFIGIELKESYYRQAVANLKNAVAESQEQDLFAEQKTA